MNTPIQSFPATPRTETGKGAAGRLRSDGKLPAVIYGANGEAESLQLDSHTFHLLLSRTTTESLLLDLEIEGGDTKRVLVKDIQHHAVNPEVIHVDFQAIEAGRKVRLAVSIDFTGTPVGETRDGGTVDYHVRSLMVECLPKDIVTAIPADISHLGLSEHLLVKDLAVDSSKYRVLNAPNVSLVSIAKPRVSGKDTDAAAPAAEEEAETESDEAESED